jgi:hypothetical protein
MMSMLEHISLIAQVVLAFAYSGAGWGCVSLIIWAVYCILQYLYYRDYNKEIIAKDQTYKRWRDSKGNATIVGIMSFLGTYISWRFYKLLYSHYFGYQIKTTDFSDSRKF